MTGRIDQDQRSVLVSFAHFLCYFYVHRVVGEETRPIQETSVLIFVAGSANLDEELGAGALGVRARFLPHLLLEVAVRDTRKLC